MLQKTIVYCLSSPSSSYFLTEYNSCLYTINLARELIVSFKQLIHNDKLGKQLSLTKKILDDKINP